MADFDINSILNSLSQEDIENIKKTAEGIFGGAAEPQKVESNAQNQNSDQGENILTGLSGLGMPDLSQLSALAPILQAFNSHDERLDFINALKPLLSQERRKKADEAMKMVRLLSVIPLLRDKGLM